MTLQRSTIIAATAAVMIAVVSVVGTTPRTTISANPNCSNSIEQATAESIAYNEANLMNFSGATITSTELLTEQESRAAHPLNLMKPVACVWFVRMSGSMDDASFGTPTPGAFVEMDVALESVSGDLNAIGLNQEAIVLTTATITPSNTPTSGPSPTSWPTPTAYGTTSPTPTP